MFETIVVPIDGSALSIEAVTPAAAIALAAHTGIRLVTVAGHDDEVERSHQRLNEAAQLLPPALPSTTEIIDGGDPVRVLLDLASDPSNVLCFASHDRHHLASALLHSVGSAVIVRATNPFIVIGPAGSTVTSPGDVVVAVDGVGDPEALLTTAAAWAKQLNAPLRIVTVYEPVPADVRQPDHYTRRHGPPGDPEIYLDAQRRRVDDLGGANVTVATIPDPVSVSDGLEAHLKRQPAFLVVVGSGTSGLWPPSVLRGLLRGSPPPVLVVNDTR